MRRKLVGLAVTALLISTSARSAAAQARGYFGVGAGLSLPLGSFKDEAKLGWLGQAIAGVTAKNGMWGGRVDASYARYSLKDLGTGESGHDALLGFNADVVLTPGHSASKARPYILAGVGLYNVKFSETIGSTSVSSSETKFAFNGGVGVNVKTSGNMAVFIEARFVSVQATGGSANFIPVVIGLRWGGF